MVAYTSSTTPYAAARELYRSQHFVRTAAVPEYYNTGDDLHIYTRRLQATGQGSQRAILGDQSRRSAD